MLKAYPFGAWTPDLSPTSDHLVTAKNVRSGPNGYGPVKDFSAITPAMAAAFVGGTAFTGSDGTTSLLAATAANLYRYSSGAFTSVLAVATTSRWRFTQFGDNAIYANGGALGSYDLVAGTAAAIAGAPTARDVATVRDFVVVIEPDGDELAVQWSGFNDSTEWVAGTNQSDIQPLLSGGRGVAIVGGEYGLVLQKNAIKRMTYVGPPTIFQFDEISAEVGCMAMGSVAQAGRLVFFLSERGFMMCDGGEVQPIGVEQVDRSFFSAYSREDIENGIYAAVDPRNHEVIWSMPGSPGKQWRYNWIMKRWTQVETSLKAVFSGFTANVTLEGVDALFPSGLDSVTYSLDDPYFQGGSPLLLVVNASYVIGAHAGSNMAATFEIPNVEPTPGRRARIRSIRPIGDMDALSVTLDSRVRPGDAENLVEAGSMRGNGKMPIRANGRYNDVLVEIDAGETWTYAQGVEIEFEPGPEK